MGVDVVHSHQRSWAAAVVLAAGFVVMGCGGGGGGGGGGAPAATFVATGATPAIRADIRTGASVPSTSLQGLDLHHYVFPATPGDTFTLEIDTQPSARPIQIFVVQSVPNGAGGVNTTVLVPEKTVVTTPYTTALTASADSTINVLVFDHLQANLTLSNLSVLADQQQANTSSFVAVIHIAGDSFAGFGAHNDLATVADKQQFVSDLLSGVNTVWAQTGVQIDIGGSAFDTLTTAQVQAAEPSLVQSGRTVLDGGDLGLNAPARRWGNLGVPTSDPLYGLALDIFIVQNSVVGSAGVAVLGFNAGVPLRSQGGVFEGTGLTHSLTFSIFDETGQPQTMSTLITILAHELGHFLSLIHTTEQTFVPDDLSDTPFSTSSHDTNSDGALNPLDTLQACPDFSNLMFPFAGGQTQLSAEQGLAMRAYLAIREH